MIRNILLGIGIIAFLTVIIYNSAENHRIHSELTQIENHNRDSINKAKEISLKLKKAEISKNKIKLLPKLKRTYDDVENISFYQDKNTSNYYGNRFYMYFYIIQSSLPVPKFRISYLSDNWLFIESVTIKADNKNYYINRSSNDNTGIRKVLEAGDIYEEINIDVDKNIEAMIVAVINSKKAKIRLNGRDYYDDRVVSNNEKQALKRVYNIYKSISL